MTTKGKTTMKTTEKTALSHIRGTVDGLLAYPLSGQARGAALADAILWASAYHEAGLSFSKVADSATLRALTKSGFLEADGKTKSQGHRLTWKGVLATQSADGDNSEDIVLNLKTLAQMPEHDLTVGSGIEGFRLVPEIITANKARKASQKYYEALGTFDVTIAPLLAMRWIEVSFDMSGICWAVKLTDAGRAAISTTPPDCSHDLDLDFCVFDIDAWKQGMDEARRIVTSKPPVWTENRVPFFLSSGAAWQHLGDYTFAKAEKELDAAQAAAMKIDDF